jgi:phosphatidylglycerophosphatase A
LVAESGDAGWIVIDEATGAFVSLIGIMSWPAALAAFAVFRLADIAKTWFPGVAAAERMPGAAGVITDDLVAGLYGLAAGHIMQALL